MKRSAEEAKVYRRELKARTHANAVAKWEAYQRMPPPVEDVPALDPTQRLLAERKRVDTYIARQSEESDIDLKAIARFSTAGLYEDHLTEVDPQVLEAQHELCGTDEAWKTRWATTPIAGEMSAADFFRRRRVVAAEQQHRVDGEQIDELALAGRNGFADVESAMSALDAWAIAANATDGLHAAAANFCGGCARRFQDRDTTDSIGPELLSSLSGVIYVGLTTLRNARAEPFALHCWRKPGAGVAFCLAGPTVCWWTLPAVR